MALAALPAPAAETRKTYTLEGVVAPVRFARVSISGSSAHSDNAQVYWVGKFKFKKAPHGSYVVTAYAPRVGEFRQTYDIGPTTVDDNGRITADI